MAAKIVTKISAGNLDGNKVVFCTTPVGTETRGAPFMYKDTDNNGVCGATETTKYSNFTTVTIKAALNINLCTLDPGSWAHNFTYCGQILYDALVDLGGDTTGMTRP